MADVICKWCGEPWELDSLHETGATFEEAARLFRRDGCGALETHPHVCFDHPDIPHGFHWHGAKQCPECLRGAGVTVPHLWLLDRASTVYAVCDDDMDAAVALLDGAA